MICPFCGKEMKNGFVRGAASRSIWDSHLYWEDDERKTGLFKKSLKLHAHHHTLGFPFIKAYMCDQCKKIIMDTYVVEK